MTKRLGPPLDLPGEQLDHAAEPTPVDVAASRILWSRAAPPRFADLLDAAQLPVSSDALQVRSI